MVNRRSGALDTASIFGLADF
uniref:Copper-transporting ATPase PAA1ic-like isoform X1 n=1 Tax=Rhizophora mucronata TaxID=61149 RepID=A0A2P2JIY9_RHIMU